MGLIDWLILIIPVIFIIEIGLYSRRSVRSVADFLSAGRVCGRYVICASDFANSLSIITLVSSMLFFLAITSNGNELSPAGVNTPELQYPVRSSGWSFDAGAKTGMRNGQAFVELSCDKANKSVTTKYGGVKLLPDRHYELSYTVTAFGKLPVADGFHYRLFLTWDRALQVDNNSDDIVLFSDRATKRKVTFRVPIKTGSNIMAINCLLQLPCKIVFSDFELRLLPEQPQPGVEIELDSPLYSGYIFHSYPLAEIKGELRFGKKAYRAKLSLLNSSEKVLWEKQFEKSETFSIPCSGLKDGTYILLATSSKANGKSLPPQKKLLRKLPASKCEVVIDNRKNLRINGRPFMPIILGHATLSNIEQSYYYFARNGVNTIYYDATNDPAKLKKLLDIAAEYGLKVIMETDFPKTMGKKDIEIWENYIKQVFTKEVREHKAFLLYSLPDEPRISGKSLDALIYAYKFIKKWDPYRPTWINVAPRGSVKELAGYAKATDIYGVDIYPVPVPHPHNDLSYDRELTCVGSYTKKMRKTVDDRKPIYMYLQAFAWANLTGQGQPVYPTYREQRFMIYDSIISRARGLGFWGSAYAKDTNYLAGVFVPNLKECGEMSAVFLADKWRNVEVRCSSPELRYITRDVNGDKFVIVANSSKKAVSVNIKLIGSGLDKMNVLYEGRKVNLRNNAFADKFGAFEVHVYATGGLPERLYPIPKLNPALESKTCPLNAHLGQLMNNANWIGGVHGEKTVKNLIRHKFNVETMLTSAELKIKSQDICAVYINGVFLAKNEKGGNMPPYAIAKLLSTGTNVLSFELKKNGSQHGTKADIDLVYKNHPATHVSLNYQWENGQ